MHTVARVAGFRASVLPARVAPQARYEYRHGEHELALTLPEVDDRQLSAFTQGTGEFALVVEDPLVMIGARFGDAIPWSLSSCCWHRAAYEDRVLPPEPGSPREARIFLLSTLVDRNVVRATRGLTLSLDFSRALHDALREQARTSYDPKTEERVLSRLRRRYPTDAALIACSQVRCKGTS